jgi:hypothetical protein
MRSKASRERRQLDDFMLIEKGGERWRCGSGNDGGRRS